MQIKEAGKTFVSRDLQQPRAKTENNKTDKI